MDQILIVPLTSHLLLWHPILPPNLLFGNSPRANGYNVDNQISKFPNVVLGFPLETHVFPSVGGGFVLFDGTGKPLLLSMLVIAGSNGTGGIRFNRNYNNRLAPQARINLLFNACKVAIEVNI